MVHKSCPDFSVRTQIPENFTNSLVTKTNATGFRLVDKHQAAAILSVSPETLKKYRLQENSPLIEGIHYFVWNSRVIRYNPSLLADWAIHRNNPGAHQKAIEAYLASLPCNQPKKRGRQAS